MQNKISAIVCSGIAFLGLTLPAYAQSTLAKVERVAYCRAPWICNDTTATEYHWWEDAGVPDQAQKNTYLSRYNEPSIANTENIVYLASGMRPTPSLDSTPGKRNELTGQYDWAPFEKTESYRYLPISQNSIAYNLLSRGIFSPSNTFIGLGFDARYNGDFSRNNLQDIVNAHYAWLKSKANPSRLKSVYLAGHSRGGALVLRIAQLFKRDYPNVNVIVDTFEPVARACNLCPQFGDINRDKLDVYKDIYFNNPLVNYPQGGGVNFSGNWVWTTDVQALFPKKGNLVVNNYLNGGKMPVWLAFDTRAFGHERNGNRPYLDLGWYRQQWFWVPSESYGHYEIAIDQPIINLALDNLSDRLDILNKNIAPAAQATASSTFCMSDCYSPARVNDRDMDSRLGPSYSWTNDGYQTEPQWLQLTWPSAIRTDHIETISTEGYELRDFSLQYLTDGQWLDFPGPVTKIRDGNGATIVADFNPIETTAIRLVNMTGSEAQPGYSRINEILVRQAMPPAEPNIAPLASANASSTFSGYSPSKANDGDPNTALGGDYSWANEGYQTQTQWLELTWPSPISTQFIEVYSTDGYALRGFDVEYFADGAWHRVPSSSASTTNTHTAVTFGRITTQRLRLINFIGPAHQSGYFRVNEFIVHGAQ